MKTSMSNSVRIQVSNYAILEYIYGDSSSTVETDDFLSIRNTKSGPWTFVNKDRSANRTFNVLDNTFVESSKLDRMYVADRDVDFNLEEIVDEIDVNDTLNIPSGYSTEYDRVRIHILAGYNLNGIDGVGIRIAAEENSGRKTNLASFIHIKGNKTPIPNSDPFTISDQIYDKYIEFLVPSLSSLTTDFYTGTTVTDRKLASYLSSDGKGFKKQSPISVQFFQFFDPVEENGAITYAFEKVVDTNLPQTDQSSKIAGVIQESDEGDYYEYFATYDGKFIDDYISLLFESGKSYIIMNDISVFEVYADNRRVKVYDLSTVQNSNFDRPNIYRPIISEDAVGFNITYTMRLVDSDTGAQIIKTSAISGSGKDARKYGRSLSKISVKESSSPVRIYNRIVDKQYTKPQNTSLDNIKSTRPVVRYVKEYNVSTSISYLTPDGDNPISTDTIIYPNGKGSVNITPFDNNIRLYFFTQKPGTIYESHPIQLTDLSTTGPVTGNPLAMVFTENNGSKKYIYSESGTIEGNSVIFRIPKREAVKIREYSDKGFSIIHINSSGSESVLHEGSFTTSMESQNEKTESVLTGFVESKKKELDDYFEETRKKLDEIKKATVSDITSTDNTRRITNTVDPVKNNSLTNNTEKIREIIRSTDKERKSRVVKNITSSVDSIIDGINSPSYSVTRGSVIDDITFDFSKLNIESPDFNNLGLDKPLMSIKPSFKKDIKQLKNK